MITNGLPPRSPKQKKQLHYHFDQVLQEPPKLCPKDVMENRRLMEMKLGPGSHKPKNFIEELQKKPGSVRGICDSRDKRFKNVNSETPGPGTYNLSSDLLKSKKHSLATNSPTIPRNSIVIVKDSGVGPGTYNLKSFTDDLLTRSFNKKGTAYRTERFPKISSKNSEINDKLFIHSNTVIIDPTVRKPQITVDRKISLPRISDHNFQYFSPGTKKQKDRWCDPGPYKLKSFTDDVPTYNFNKKGTGYRTTRFPKISRKTCEIRAKPFIHTPAINKPTVSHLPPITVDRESNVSRTSEHNVQHFLPDTKQPGRPATHAFFWRNM